MNSIENYYSYFGLQLEFIVETVNLQ